MSRFLPTLALLFVGVVASAAEPSSDPNAGVLLLRNGQVLRGEVVLLGDRYHVTLNGGAEIRIPIHAAEMKCRDMDEAYAIKNQAAQRGSISEHFDLAEWCLRHEMYSNAAEQLTLAMRRDTAHPRVAVIERRLQAAVSRLVTTEPPPPTSPTFVAPENFESVLRELPHGSVETFTSVVQPILVNRCGANGCHGSLTKSDYRIFQPSIGQTLTRRFTQRNLQSTLSMLDKQDPEKSRFLTKIREPHGSLPRAVFSDREEGTYRQLAMWVQQVSRPRAVASAKETNRSESVPQVAATANVVNSPALETEGMAEGKNRDTLQSTLNNIVSPPKSARPDDAQGTKTLSTGASREFLPRDPFDPEIFNRRFFGHPEKDEK